LLRHPGQTLQLVSLRCIRTLFSILGAYLTLVGLETEAHSVGIELVRGEFDINVP